MKIMLFQGGAEGAIVTIPGEFPAAELEELLGGEVKPMRLNERLTLVVVAESDVPRPRWYGLHSLGSAILRISGDCAVVVMTRDGQVMDMEEKDLELVRSYICTMRESEARA